MSFYPPSSSAPHPTKITGFSIPSHSSPNPQQQHQQPGATSPNGFIDPSYIFAGGQSPQTNGNNGMMGSLGMGMGMSFQRPATLSDLDLFSDADYAALFPNGGGAGAGAHNAQHHTFGLPATSVGGGGGAGQYALSQADLAGASGGAPGSAAGAGGGGGYYFNGPPATSLYPHSPHIHSPSPSLDLFSPGHPLHTPSPHPATPNETFGSYSSLSSSIPPPGTPSSLNKRRASPPDSSSTTTTTSLGTNGPSARSRSTDRGGVGKAPRSRSARRGSTSYSSGSPASAAAIIIPSSSAGTAPTPPSHPLAISMPSSSALSTGGGSWYGVSYGSETTAGGGDEPSGWKPSSGGVVGSAPTLGERKGRSTKGLDDVEEEGGTTGKAALLTEKRRKRRESHNAVERRRRDNINDRISDLASLLPEVLLEQATNGADDGDEGSPSAATGLGGASLVASLGTGPEMLVPSGGTTAGGKPNKGNVLSKSVEYIRYLQQLVELHSQRNNELESLVADLRSTSLHGPPPSHQTHNHQLPPQATAHSHAMQQNPSDGLSSSGESPYGNGMVFSPERSGGAGQGTTEDWTYMLAGMGVKEEDEEMETYSDLPNETHQAILRNETSAELLGRINSHEHVNRTFRNNSIRALLAKPDVAIVGNSALERTGAIRFQQWRRWVAKGDLHVVTIPHLELIGMDNSEMNQVSSLLDPGAGLTIDSPVGLVGPHLFSTLGFSQHLTHLTFRLPKGTENELEMITALASHTQSTLTSFNIVMESWTGGATSYVQPLTAIVDALPPHLTHLGFRIFPILFMSVYIEPVISSLEHVLRLRRQEAGGASRLRTLALTTRLLFGWDFGNHELEGIDELWCDDASRDSPEDFTFVPLLTDHARHEPAEGLDHLRRHRADRSVRDCCTLVL
ncbi:hypothetical protein MNV49_004551 [Pseudohyphozyma bogoriensis]|nr:hypothetical protein MNV49_004551 [Pseudohyphozyma bogoriensis]